MVLKMILKSHVEQNDCNWLYQKKNLPQNLNEYLLSEKEKKKWQRPDIMKN